MCLKKVAARNQESSASPNNGNFGDMLFNIQRACSVAAHGLKNVTLQMGHSTYYWEAVWELWVMSYWGDSRESCNYSCTYVIGWGHRIPSLLLIMQLQKKRERALLTLQSCHRSCLSRRFWGGFFLFCFCLIFLKNLSSRPLSMFECMDFN